MATIQVQTLTPLGNLYGQDVSVAIDGECNHAGAEVQMVEYVKESWYSDAHRYAADDSEELPTLVCRCGYTEVMERDIDDGGYCE